MNKPVLICHNTTDKAVIVRETDGRTRVYKYITSPADLLDYFLPPETEDIIRALLPLTE